MQRIHTLALVCAAGMACTALAQPQSQPQQSQPPTPLAPWPQRAIKIVTPTPPGVGSDIFARSYADQLSRLLKVPVIVENKPGALSTIGTDAVAKAAPDGYTVLFSTSNPFTMTPFLLSRLPYDAEGRPGARHAGAQGRLLHRGEQRGAARRTPTNWSRWPSGSRA
jgi:tripartite-type tricarboxylate transporter receptor subunit TctC